MKRTILIAALAVQSLGIVAQTKAVHVDSPIVSEKDFVWYVEQKDAWRAETQKDPTNETAWENYYYAARNGLPDSDSPPTMPCFCRPAALLRPA